jgi:type VI secretion system protein VasD
MKHSMIRLPLLAAASFAILTFAGCGVGQAVKSGTVDAAKWAFTTQVKTMNLDLISRSSLNISGGGQSLSTVVRIYQLKTPQAFEQLDYSQLQINDLDALKADLLGTTDVVLRPNANASISEPMNGDAQYVAVVAFFRDDGRESTWRLLVPKKKWKKTDPVKVEVRDSTLQLAGGDAQTIKRQAPLKSVQQPVKPTVKSSPVKDDWARPG